MRELFERMLSFVPQYFEDMIALVSGPKGFVLQRTSNSNGSLTDALSFFAMSFIAGWLLKISFVRGDPLMDLAAGAVFVAFFVMAFGAAVCLAWRLVSGQIDFKVIFLIYVYYSAVTRLISVCAFLILIDCAKIIYPGLYRNLIKAAYTGRMTEFILQYSDEYPFWLSVIACLYVLLLLVWLIVGWGAYRIVTSSSKSRSAIAAILFILFSIAINALMFFIAEGATEP
jgi:hypothetical protein